MISDLQTLEKLEIKKQKQKHSNSRDWEKASTELKVGEANG